MNCAGIRNKLRLYIDKGITRFIIFPFGEIGMQVKQVLNECYGILEEALVDNELCNYNPKIKNTDFLKNYLLSHDNEDIYLICASMRWPVLEIAAQCCPEEKLIMLMPSAFQKARGTYGPLLEDSDHIESIGAFCSFAPGVTAVFNHPLNFVANHAFMYSSAHDTKIINQKISSIDVNRKYIIGHDVWLGQNVILTNGVKIGNGVRAAAGSVITEDVPDYAVVAGVPAKIVKYRFTSEQIMQLNEIAWWNWPSEKINECYDDFMDINIFLSKHYPPSKDKQLFTEL